ncbi:desulfoferrodoxin family protein [Chakrabartyella piscis]|uniref:desulfoferrodoxin family protein n=1 Tax=Chakrabartyella piscis TaxID=2918914 RepID=UPI0029587AF1|nr:desulfoferrodoxin family protein [Chakrabartyella piscis]
MSKFVVCQHCKNIALMVEDKGVPMMCCGQKMDVLNPNTTEAAVEKHIPIVTVAGNVVTVKVAEVAHPMTEAHLISWIYLETSAGGQMKYFSADMEVAEAQFVLAEGEVAVAAYEYCNLHGLWKAEV